MGNARSEQDAGHHRDSQNSTDDEIYFSDRKVSDCCSNGYDELNGLGQSYREQGGCTHGKQKWNDNDCSACPH